MLGPQGVAASLADWATIYWLAAIATGLVACLSFSRYRSRRSGVGRRAWPVLAAGAVVLALAILDAPVVLARLSPSPGDVPSGLAVADLHIRGLTSLLVLAAVVLALGLAERSGALAGFGVVFFAVTVVANLYDLDNLLARVGWTLGPSTVAMANVAIPGVVLLAGGALFAVLDRRPRTARTDPGGLARG